MVQLFRFLAVRLCGIVKSRFYEVYYYYYVYAMNIMHSPEHEIIIAPVYTTQTNS